MRIKLARLFPNDPKCFQPKSGAQVQVWEVRDDLRFGLKHRLGPTPTGPSRSAVI